MLLSDGCHSLKLECALRDLGFVDIGWKCVAHAGIFFIEPVGIPDDPEGDLLGFTLKITNIRRPEDKVWRMVSTARKAMDLAGTQRIYGNNL